MINTYYEGRCNTCAHRYIENDTGVFICSNLDKPCRDIDVCPLEVDEVTPNCWLKTEERWGGGDILHVYYSCSDCDYDLPSGIDDDDKVIDFVYCPYCGKPKKYLAIKTRNMIEGK